MQNFRSSGRDQVHEGMDVLDLNGEKIGKAGETLGSYFNVDAGFLGMKEYYVPFDAVTEIQENAVYVNAYKGDLGDTGWDRKPEERVGQGQSDTTYTSTAGSRGQTGDRMQLREEELRARTTPVETGRVSVGKEVVEEQRTMEVPVSREEVYVDRKPVERRPADTPIGDSQRESIQVPVREEQVQVEKQPVVYEEVGLGKKVTQDTEQVSETVRREELRTDKKGDAPLRDDRSR
ncbi:MAG: YsnF/AvaK domain-containing protein [Chloroflexi bacterium]|nr:YsnF/AvaK domain-containing protein [Chloroflexota bacterium]